MSKDNSKKAKVVMLPTNKKAKLFLDKEGIYTKNRVDDSILRHYLYITNYEEIKEGEWYVYLNKVWQATETTIKKGHAKQPIIATTDPELCITKQNRHLGQAIIPLPRPTEGFIKKYIEKYNKGEVITDVLVEYDKTLGGTILGWEGNNRRVKCHTCERIFLENEGECHGGDILSVNYDTITIHPIKQSWNREEVIEICKSAFETGKLKGYIWEYGEAVATDPKAFLKWIEENL
jgi:hypothetical protein